jgi:hypothetical protein
LYRLAADKRYSLGITVALTPKLQAHFESIGPAGVKREMAEGKRGQAPDSRNWLEAQTWVEAELIQPAQETDTRRDAREERTLAVTELALEIAKESAAAAQRSASAAEAQAAAAKRQVRWALWAAVIAVMAAVSTANSQLQDLASWLQK